MNSQEMLDHAFGLLEGTAREKAEAELAANPEYAERFDLLVRAVHDLCDDGLAFDPPADLASRTMTFVSENRRTRRRLFDFVPRTVPFRWADVAVAAGIMLAGLLTLVPAMHRSRDRMNQAACVFNLQQLGLGLAQYGHQNRAYPYQSPEDCPQAAAGSFAAILHDAGLLENVAVLDCPCNGACAYRPLPPLDTLSQIKNDDPDRYEELLCWDYAYHGGYRSGVGPAQPLTTPCSKDIPLLADQPAHETDLRRILPGNSPNHGGLGQNVLFSDLHVGWHNSRRLGPHDLDMFLNDVQQPGPGLRMHDAVLLPSVFPFSR